MNTNNIGSSSAGFTINRNFATSRAESRIAGNNLNMTTVGGQIRNAPGIPINNETRNNDRSPVPNTINLCNYSTIGDQNLIQAKTYASGFGLHGTLSPSPNIAP